MTDIVTLSPGCDYCLEPAEFQCGHCGAYGCIDHIVNDRCPGCQPLTQEELEDMSIEDTPCDLLAHELPGVDW